VVNIVSYMSLVKSVMNAAADLYAEAVLAKASG
jgi:hypothetical protein